MISIEAQEKIIKAIIRIANEDGCRDVDYNISHLVQSAVGDNGKGNEMCISFKYDKKRPAEGVNH